MFFLGSVSAVFTQQPQRLTARMLLRKLHDSTGSLVQNNFNAEMKGPEVHQHHVMHYMFYPYKRYKDMKILT